MERVRLLANAYSLAPWRKQLQIIVGFLLILVMAALIGSVYLYVSSQAVSAGVDIQRMNHEMTAMRLAIEDYESTLADLTSERVMAERADNLGFEPVEPEEMVYMTVPGYPGRESVKLAPPPSHDSLANSLTPALSPEFSESLLEWIAKNLLTPSGDLAEVGR